MVIIWLFDTSGFASVVAYKPSKDIKKSKHREIAEQSTDPNGWLLVRARIKADLEEIQRKIGLDIFIDKDASADYAYRALVTKDTWKAYLTAEVDNIDYDSHFKEVSRDRAPKNEGRYSAMMSVWTAMARLQDVSPYSGGYYSGWSGGSGKSGTAASHALVGSKAPSYGSYDSKSVFDDPYENRIEFSTPTYTVGVEEMAKALKEAAGPSSVDSETVNAADDNAFELWVRAYDRAADSRDGSLTDEQIDSLSNEVEREG